MLFVVCSVVLKKMSASLLLLWAINRYWEDVRQRNMLNHVCLHERINCLINLFTVSHVTFFNNVLISVASVKTYIAEEVMVQTTKVASYRRETKVKRGGQSWPIFSWCNSMQPFCRHRASMIKQNILTCGMISVKAFRFLLWTLCRRAISRLIWWSNVVSIELFLFLIFFSLQ